MNEKTPTASPSTSTGEERASRRFPGWRSRWTTRVRTAVAAGVVSLLLAGAGAWWLREHTYDSQYAATRRRAQPQVEAASAELIRTEQDPTAQALGDANDILPLAFLPPNDAPLFSWLDEAFPATIGALPRVPSGAPPNWTATVRAHFGTPAPHCGGETSVQLKAWADACDARANALAHQTLEMVGTSFQISESEGLPAGPSGLSPGRYTVYLVVDPADARQAVDSLTPALAAAVPLAALTVACTAWIATSRALRPVEAIRTRLASVQGTSLHHRVPVPPAEDEIARLARTTNETLDTLDRFTTQQRRFTADAAHELRSPVTGLRTTLEVALAHPEAPHTAEALTDAMEATHRLQQLIDDLLILAQPSSTRASHHALAEVNLADLARDLLNELPYTYPRTPPLTLTLHAPTAATLQGDAGQLRRLLRNLLDNAARHADSSIEVSIAVQDGRIRCEVHNDGTAIPAADQERIFERFTRLDQARSRETGGTGLGLAIARDIALRHHGTLTLAPTPDGATFQIILPQVTLPPAPTAADADSE